LIIYLAYPLILSSARAAEGSPMLLNTLVGHTKSFNQKARGGGGGGGLDFDFTIDDSEAKLTQKDDDDDFSVVPTPRFSQGPHSFLRSPVQVSVRSEIFRVLFSCPTWPTS
jgi:hypothetical protein